MENKENCLQILTAKDLMEELHLGKDRAYALMRSSSFPSMQIGKTYFVTKDNLERWLNNNVGKKIAI